MGIGIAWAGRPTVRLYDRLFNHEAPDKGDNAISWRMSTRIRCGWWSRPGSSRPWRRRLPEQGFQFEREGYFVADRHDHSAQAPVFNRTIGLRDSWGEQAGEAE